MTAAADTLTPDDFDALDALLDRLRDTDEDAPQWEFCDGFIAALACCREPPPPSEYFPLLVGVDAVNPDDTEAAEAFGNDAIAQARFVELWQRRLEEVRTQLDTPVEALDDERAYHPEVVDVRGALLTLPEADRPPEGEETPSFAQIWALGFLFALETWPERYELPRDPEVAEWYQAAMASVLALTEDDTAAPTLSMHAEDGPPSVSDARADAFYEAIWAVYDLRQIARTLGPRVEPLRRADEPGRNDPCPCGSGKKYKKCHGA
jgi:uncharacterized protein